MSIYSHNRRKGFRRANKIGQLQVRSVGRVWDCLGALTFDEPAKSICGRLVRRRVAILCGALTAVSLRAVLSYVGRSRSFSAVGGAGTVWGRHVVESAS